MSSIIDSFREVFSDKFSFFKLLILSAPVYYSYYLYVNSKGNFAEYGWISILTILLVLGFLTKVTNNVINERDWILPSFNPFPILYSGVKCVLAIGVFSYVFFLLANYICSFINIIEWLDITLKFLIWTIFASIIVTSFLMFAQKEKVLDAYKLKVLGEKAGDLIVVLLFFILQITIINIPTTFFIGYTLLILFGFGFLFDFYVIFAIMFNVSVIGHYLGQIHYETLGFKVNGD